MAYAVISDRGKQYTVRPGERVRLDRNTAEAGAKIVFDKILLLGGGDDGSVKQGDALQGVRVEGTVLRHGRGKKVIVFKIRRRKGYRRKQGHRQDFTDVRIDSVVGG
jgi:large subunit ribosomal protein L21